MKMADCVPLHGRVHENGIVERVEIAELIKCLMEGEECVKLCNNLKELLVATNTLKEYGPSSGEI